MNSHLAHKSVCLRYMAMSFKFKIYIESSYPIDMTMTYADNLAIHGHMSQKTHTLTFKSKLLKHIFNKLSLKKCFDLETYLQVLQLFVNNHGV